MQINAKKKYNSHLIYTRTLEKKKTKKKRKNSQANEQIYISVSNAEKKKLKQVRGTQ